MTLLKQQSKEQHNTTVLADKGYDSQELIDTLHNQNCSSVIPSRKKAKCPREIDRGLYKERFLIEVFFSKLKQFSAFLLALIKLFPPF